MQLRKVMRFVRLRLVPLLVSGVILVSPLSLCANAAAWEGIVKTRVDYWGVSNGIHYQMSGGSVNAPLSDSGWLLTPKNNSVCNGMYFLEDSVTWTGPVDVYIGGYMRSVVASEKITISGDPYDYNNYDVTYRGSDGQSGAVLGTKAEFSRFTPNETRPHGDGITARVSFIASEGAPISEIRLCPAVESGWYKPASANNGEWIITSLRVISSESSAELDELNEVTDQLIANNQLLAAMQGDIVALLQDIYREVGDINIAADAMRTILTALVQYVDDIESGLIEINGELVNIYSLMGSFMVSMESNLKSLYKMLDGYLMDMEMTLRDLSDFVGQIYDGLFTSDHVAGDEAFEQVQEGSSVQDSLGDLQKPAIDSIIPDMEQYVPETDAEGLTNFMGVVFSNNIVRSMLMITLSMSLVAYVLYGKR